MARISQSNKEKITAYAADLDVEYYCHRCNNIDEVDAVKTCIVVIDMLKLKYHKAVEEAPRNIPANLKARSKHSFDGFTEEEARNLYQYLEDHYPRTSYVKSEKSDILNYCKYLLEDVGMGKKRILETMPMLTEYLQESLEFDLKAEQLLKDLKLI